MTTFLKVYLPPYIQREVPVSDSSSARRVVLGGEKIRVGRQGWEQVTSFIFGFYYSEVQLAHLPGVYWGIYDSKLSC